MAKKKAAAPKKAAKKKVASKNVVKKDVQKKKPTQKKRGSYGVNNPKTLLPADIESYGSGYVLKDADGTFPGNANSAKAWVYTTFLPFGPPSPPPCAVLAVKGAGTNWSYSGLPSPQGNVNGNVPNTFVIWYFASANGTGAVLSSEVVYFYGRI